MNKYKKYKVIFESQVIDACDNCPLQTYERESHSMWCAVQDTVVSAKFESEQWWREAMAELMANCPLEVVE